MLNINFEKFKRTHKKNINQVLYYKLKSNNSKEVENLINNFLQDKNSFVFESVEKGIIKGRYTIFGKNPDKIWEFNNKNIYYINKNKKKKIKGDPVKIINNIIKNFNFKTPKKLPPLCSLLAGYFSYDTIRYFEKIKDTCIDDLKIPDIRIMRPTTLVIHDNLQKKIFFIKNCFSDKKISNYEKKYNQIQDELNNIIIQSKISASYSDKKLVKKTIKSNISKKQFLKNVKQAKKYIQIGDIFQVVLSQRFETKLTKKPLSIYKKLRLTNPSPFMFYFNFEDFQIIGASPEILVRLRDNEVTIRPIAGTRPRGKNISEDNFYKKDLLSDKKEISEHLMLLDLGRNDIGKISKINTVKVTEQFKIEKYSHVMHIVSNVTGEFDKKKSKYDTLMAGFPAGTVSGAPKIRAMEIIDELEKNKRKIYAGGIGYFSANGDFDTCIALRTALAKNGKYYVQAGAGIVADSIPEKEFQETVNKSKALIKALD
ncbi:anthranilate synthase component I [Candidatus Pelagibacter sp.]|nr:anthranilate synthase component I [Candidatus Pelagibacter sp.]